MTTRPSPETFGGTPPNPRASWAEDAQPAPQSATVGTHRASKVLEHAMFEVKRVVVGQDLMIERLFVCLLSRGHCLLEGPPGLAKTLAAETLAKVIGGHFARIQFTPDLVPADLVGTRIYRPSSETFDTELGPIFANVVLTDEINRAPAKVQSALLEAMAERHVSIGGHTYAVPTPFLVLATQNPIESEGVYPLPEAQRDRFMMKVLVDYPTPREETEIVRRMSVSPPLAETVLGATELVSLQQAADEIFIHNAIIDYAVRITAATRAPAEYGLPDLVPLIAHGDSPRGTLALVAGSRALALLRGRDYVLPQEVYDVARDILRHRVFLSYEALADGVGADEVVERVLRTVPAPRLAPSQDAGLAGASAERAS